MLREIFHKDILLFLLANIFADVTIQNFELGFISIMPGFQDEAACLEKYIFAAVINLNFLSRIVILPVIYEYIENKSENLILKNFIFHLKKSHKAKFYVLLINTIYTFILISLTLNIYSNFDIKFFIFIFVVSILMSLFFGLMGSYIALYLYWYLNKKFYKLRNILHFIFNKYTVIIALLSNLLAIGMILNHNILNFVVKVLKIFL